MWIVLRTLPVAYHEGCEGVSAGLCEVEVTEQVGLSSKQVGGLGDTANVN